MASGPTQAWARKLSACASTYPQHLPGHWHRRSSTRPAVQLHGNWHKIEQRTTLHATLCTPRLTLKAWLQWYCKHILPVNDLLSMMADKLTSTWAHPALHTAYTRTYTGPGHGSVIRFLQQIGLPRLGDQGDGSYAALPHTWLAVPARLHTCLMRFSPHWGHCIRC